MQVLAAPAPAHDFWDVGLAVPAGWLGPDGRATCAPTCGLPWSAVRLRQDQHVRALANHPYARIIVPEERMIDFIKLLADSLIKIIPLIGEYKQKKGVQDIATRLFLVYIRLLDCLNTAEQILTSMESYLEDVEEGEAWRAVYFRSTVARELRAQQIDIDRLHDALGDLNSVLVILDKNIKNQVNLFVEGKKTALGALLSAMEDGFVPLFKIEPDLASRILAYMHSEPSRIGSDLNIELINVINSGDFLDVDEDENDDTPEIDLAALISAYLNKGQIREEFARIGTTIDQLRAVLGENFSVIDVLPEVERRLAR